MQASINPDKNPAEFLELWFPAADKPGPSFHFFELVNGAPDGFQPLKHTVNVQPGGSATFDLTANEPGDWAFHCHLFFHMHQGMFQVVTVRPLQGGVG